MSDVGRDFWKAAILTLVLTGLGFLVGGWVLGVICVAVAAAISLILWTPLGPWLGFHPSEARSPVPLPESSSRRGDLAPRARDRSEPVDRVSGRIYGGAAVGAAIRQLAARQEEEAVFVAAEGEIGLALEEAAELKRLLFDEGPWITPKGTELEAAVPDWSEKTTAFIATVLGPGQRAAFRTIYTGNDPTDRLEAEAKFLAELARGIEPEAIRVDEAEILAAREARRENRAARFLEYDHFRAPGAPPPADLGERIDLLMREGIDLVGELRVPVEAQRTRDGGLEVSGGEAPAEWQEKANEFRKEVWELLAERYPALLTTYRDACNATIAKIREPRRTPPSGPPGRDRRSGLEKALELANFERGGPATEVEITLDGLAAARQRLAELCGTLAPTLADRQSRIREMPAFDERPPRPDTTSG
ncbi:MAG TPA: hypothetical protein VFM94_01520 [Solirubrobacterales bacterium]|nr:hypothetical protein [Solirubrobacterales bacterium]